MPSLRTFVVITLTVTLVVLLAADLADDWYMGNKYAGVPTPLWGIFGAMVAGLLAVSARNGNGRGKKS